MRLTERHSDVPDQMPIQIGMLYIERSVIHAIWLCFRARMEKGIQVVSNFLHQGGVIQHRRWTSGMEEIVILSHDQAREPTSSRNSNHSRQRSVATAPILDSRYKPGFQLL